MLVGIEGRMRPVPGLGRLGHDVSSVAARRLAESQGPQGLSPRQAYPPADLSKHPDRIAC